MEHKHMNEIREIVYRLRQGQSVRDIAQDLGFSRNTVKKYRKRAKREGFLEKDTPMPDNEALRRILDPVVSVPKPKSTVEPHGEFVQRCLERGMELTAIWQRLQRDYGYTGSYTSVRRYVSRVRPKGEKGVCRIETKPAQEAQVDFGFAGWHKDVERGERRKAWAFVMTLSWSRHQYVEFVFDQKIETWLSCHERAFKWFGGVPERVVIDNLKSGIVLAKWLDPVLGDAYRRFAQHYGFMVSPNRPKTPEHKGKVESGVHYVKRNFLAGEEFADLEAMNARAREWCMNVAGVRKHGTTCEPPLNRFYAAEEAALKPLPASEFDLLSVNHVKVGRDCHVVVDGRYYSVPCRWIGEKVEVYTCRKVAEIYKGAELICVHERLMKRGERSTRVEHYPERKRGFFENPPERCLERAMEIGEHCLRVVETLLNDRVQYRLPSVHGLFRLGERYGISRLEAACERALHYGDGSYRRIQSILKSGLDREPIYKDRESVDRRDRCSHEYKYARPALVFFEEEVSEC